jgi:hypothetical protein
VHSRLCMGSRDACTSKGSTYLITMFVCGGDHISWTWKEKTETEAKLLLMCENCGIHDLVDH